MAGITINGITLDPEQSHAALASLGFGAPDVSDTDYVLIQLTGSPTAVRRKDLKAAGAELLEFVPQDTYLARFKGADLTPIQNLPFVHLASRYLRGFKVHPSLVAGEVKDPVAMLALEGQSNMLRSHPERVTVVLQHDAATAETINQVAAAAGVDPDGLQLFGHRIPLSVSSDRLGRIAKIDGVRHIEPQPRNGLFNDVAGRIV